MTLAAVLRHFGNYVPHHVGFIDEMRMSLGI